MTERLERNKEYEWFLVDYHPVKGPGGIRMKMVWTGVDVAYTVIEYPLLNPDGSSGRRLIELMQRMNIINSRIAADPVVPKDYLKLGVHVWAEVHRHFIEDKKDSAVWEFVYESISPKPSKVKETIPDAARTKIKFRVTQSNTLDEVRGKLEATDASLLPWFEQMVKNGEIDLK